ncbi:M12 family metallo-peptidase [Streptomyces sp. NPDC091272]|uniref:M12 family metallo-peptidase n=1 Tax=Streptomyces sp. NPDC091272 TaxID=3365981 RepID=UPI003824FC61
MTMTRSWAVRAAATAFSGLLVCSLAACAASEGPVRGPGRAGAAAGAPAGTPAGTAHLAGCPTVDVLGIYTPKAVAAVGGDHRLPATSRTIAARMNRSLKDSGVCGKIRFLRSYAATDYTGSDEFSSAYHHIKDPDDPLGAEAHRQRDRYGADLVVLLVNQPERGGGTADYTTTLDRASDEYAYSIADIQGVDLDSVSHEMGHNLGLAHDRDTIDADPEGRMRISTTRPYNTGWITPDRQYFTIMAYQGTCGPSCRRISQFSNPDRTYRGQRLGDEGSNNARVLRETLPIVAGYR